MISVVVEGWTTAVGEIVVEELKSGVDCTDDGRYNKVVEDGDASIVADGITLVETAVEESVMIS